LLGNSQGALEYLQQAINLGYNDYDHIVADNDLISLRNLEAFQALIATIKPKESQQTESKVPEESSQSNESLPQLEQLLPPHLYNLCPQIAQLSPHFNHILPQIANLYPQIAELSPHFATLIPQIVQQFIPQPNAQPEPVSTEPKQPEPVPKQPEPLPKQPESIPTEPKQPESIPTEPKQPEQIPANLPVDDALVQKFLEMGFFPRSFIKEALERSNNNFNGALQILLENL